MRKILKKNSTKNKKNKKKKIIKNNMKFKSNTNLNQLIH